MKSEKRKYNNKYFVVLKYEEGERWYVRTTDSGIQTFCEKKEDADKFIQKDAIKLQEKMQKKKTQIYYILNLQLNTFYVNNNIRISFFS